MFRICLMIFMLSPAGAVLAAEGDDRKQEPGKEFIIGGDPAFISTYPFLGAVMDRTSLDSFFAPDDKFLAQYCAGTLIAPSWVLTAAHCVVVTDPDGFPTNILMDPEQIVVVFNMTDLDSNQGDLSDVERMIVHEDFNGRLDAPTVTADIALLKLATDLTLQPVVHYNRDAAVPAGTPATITGWGADGYDNIEDEPTSFPSILQAAETMVVSNQDCVDAYAGAQVEINETHVCAAAPGVDVCAADSGAPLLVEAKQLAGGGSGFVQVGITSFGIGCADPDFPGVYTRLSEYTDWIERNMLVETLFATFGNGQSGALTLVSDIVVYNPHGSRTLGGSFLFKDAGGNLLDPADMLEAGDGSFQIPPLGSSTFSTTGTGDIVSGSVWVSSDHDLSGVIRFALSGIGIAGVSPSAPGTKLIAPARREGTVNTGVAVLNTTNEKVRVILDLKDEGGNVVAAGIQDLESMARTARFLDELFPGFDTTDFRGTVCLTAETGKIAVIAIEQGSGAGEFTTLQVTVVE